VEGTNNTSPPRNLPIQIGYYSSITASDLHDVVTLGSNIVATESNKIYIGNTIWDNKKSSEEPQIDVIEVIEKLEKRITDLQAEVDLLREMITWHPDNFKSISKLREHFESLAHTF